MSFYKSFFIFFVITLVVLQCNDKSTNSTGENQKNKKIQKKTNKDQKPTKEDLKIIIEIGDTKINNKEFKDFLKVKYPELLKVKKIKPSVYDALLEYFIERKLVCLEAKSKNLTVNDKEIKLFLSKISNQNININKNIIKEFIINQKYLYNFIYKDVKVSEKEIKKYYNSNIKEFKKKQEIFLHQILVKDKDKAIEIRGKLLNNPSLFEEFSKSESLAPDAKNGGMMGYFEKGVLPKDMEKIVFSLNINEISPVVKSSYGYHIFKISKKKNSRILYYSKVKDKIEKKLLSEKYNQIYKELIKGLKEKYKIKIIKKNLFFSKTQDEDINEVNNEENIN